MRQEAGGTKLARANCMFQEFIHGGRDVVNVGSGTTNQRRTFHLAVFPVVMMRSVGQVQVVRRIIPAQETPVALQQGVRILARRFAKEDFQHVVALKLDADLGDEIARGTHVGALGYEDFEGVSKLISHVTML